LIVQKALHGLKQKRPESPLVTIGGLHEATFDDLAKKFLGQILCVRNGVALTADESENGSPVNFAKLGKGSVRFLSIRCRVGTRKNDAPACCQEPSMRVAKGGIRSHSADNVICAVVTQAR
jgi:hypothetical protein